MSKNLITGLFTVFFGAIYLIATYNLPQPLIGDILGPKIYPSIIGIFLTLIGVILISKELLIPKVRRERLSIKLSTDGKKLLLRIVVTSLIGIAYSYLIEPLGYLIATTLFMSALLFLVNSLSRWKSNILISISFSLVTYLVFAIFLNLGLPRGIINY